MILDGFGEGSGTCGNAVRIAGTPAICALRAQ